MRGDINATELYQNRKFLEQVGLGILDIEFGSKGGVGFEDVRRFSYLESEEQDPKLYRRKVFSLTGCYYPNDLAKVLWEKFNEYRDMRSGQEDRNLELETCAKEWLEQYGHSFIKNWALEQGEVPFRMRNRAELRLGWLALIAYQLIPGWRELLKAGFDPSVIIFASYKLSRNKFQNESRERYFVRLVAQLSRLPIKDETEADRRLLEIQKLAEFLQERNEKNCGMEAATLEYYRRLNLVAEIEQKKANITPFSFATA